METENMMIEVEKATPVCDARCRWLELIEKCTMWCNDQIVGRDYVCKNKFICQDALRKIREAEHAAR